MKNFLFASLLLTAMTMSGQVVDWANCNDLSDEFSIAELKDNMVLSYDLLREAEGKRIACMVTSNTDIPADQAEVILEAHRVFGEFSKAGFQLLLDENHSVYGTLFGETSGIYEGDYSKFEYMLPSDADLSGKNSVFDGEESVLIPEGVYDYMLVYPTQEGNYFVHGDFAKGNDFEFKGGYSYCFIVEYDSYLIEGYETYDATAKLFAPVDLAIDALHLPANSMDMTAEERISIDIINRGSSAASRFAIWYRIGDNEMVSERYNKSIEAGDTITHTFRMPVDLSAEQLYEVTAGVTLEGDLIPLNNTISGKCNHMPLYQLPYFCDFSTQGYDGIDYFWTVVDANNDGATWRYGEYSKGVDMTPGVPSCTGPRGVDYGDDYLISVPLYMNEGSNHIIFHSCCVNNTKMEHLEVLYGASTDYTQMQTLASYDVTSTEWHRHAINFDVAESGVYYIAFKAASYNGYNVFVDDVTVGAGFYEVTPQLRVDKVVLPYSNCDLSDQSRVGAIVTNEGTAPTSTFTLIYTIDKQEPVSQLFTDVLAPYESRTYYFDQTADFSEVGEYEVLVEGTCATEIEGAQVGIVFNYEPITNLPLTTNFITGENYDGYWTEMTPGSWERDEMFGVFSSDKSGLENGLLTRCFALTNPVRIKLQYAKAGWEVGRIYVAYGKADAHPSTYTKVFEDNDVSKNGLEIEFDVPITVPDNYSFIIVNESDEYTGISLGTIVISELLPCDLRLLTVESPLSYNTPLAQFAEEMVVNAVVVNRGSLAMSGVKAMLYQDDVLLGTTTENVEVASCDTVRVPVKVKFAEPAVGDVLSLSISVEAIAPDEYEADNVYKMRKVIVSDTIMAHESVATPAQGLGATGQPISLGNIYELAATDELSSVSVGWVEINESMSPLEQTKVAIAIYEVVSPDRVGRKLYYKEYERGFGGWTTYQLEPMKLPTGRYLFAVEQLEVYNMGLGAHAESKAECYHNNNGVLVRNPGGTLLIRPNFAQDAIAYNHDVAPVGIVTPVKKADLYTSDETIAVRVRNFGMMSAEFDLQCTINEYSFSRQLSLLPFEEVDVCFEHIDMSAVGDYVVAVTTALSNDENTSNDFFTETLVSVEESNPYVMNFEACYDFDAAPDQFNPRWRTVDRVGAFTDYFWKYNHPYRGEAVGFIAFNPEQTVPVVDDSDLPGFRPHSGQRFGAAFCLGYGAPVDTCDVWLISPKLALSTNSSLELYVKTRLLETLEAKLEPYRLLISDTDDAFDSFKVLGDNIRLAPQEDWQLVTVDLKEYDNKEVYVAVQYVGVMLENVCLMVDDIRVKGDGIDGVSSTMGDVANVSYNAYNEVLTATASEGIIGMSIYNMQGQVVYTAHVDYSNQYRVSVAGYAPGVYIARVSTTTGCTTYKFIVGQ